jgi:hypothetical protein
VRQRPSWSRARRIAIGVAGTTAAAGTVMVLSTMASTASADPADITLCHATASTTHPYQVITVAPNSIEEKIFGANGHATHTGPVFDPTGGKNQPAWGDIIPAFSYGDPVVNYKGLNVPEGQAILDAGCKVPNEPTDTETPTSPASDTVTETGTVTDTATVTETATDTGTATDTATVTETATDTGTATESTSGAVGGVSGSTTTTAAGTTTAAAAGSSDAAAAGGNGGGNAGGNGGPIPAGVDAGKHTPLMSSGMQAWGALLMLLGGLAGLGIGVWPTRRRRAH